MKLNLFRSIPLFALFTILGCSGANQTAVLRDFKDLSAEIGFSIRDERPETETGTEVTTPFSPIVIEIAVAIDGKEFSVRNVYSPEKEIDPAFGNPESASALFAAIRKASGLLVNSIRAKMAGWLRVNPRYERSVFNRIDGKRDKRRT